MREKTIRKIAFAGVIVISILSVPMRTLAAWQINGDKWKYESDGKYLTGWWEIDGSQYYFDQAGVMFTGWKYFDGYWYYLNADGSMAHDQWVENYYVDRNGRMVRNSWIGEYYVGNDGAWIPSNQNVHSLYETYCEQNYGNRVKKIMFADITHDGKDDCIVVLSPVTRTYGDVVILTIENSIVKCITELECSHRTDFYLYEQNGKEYILGAYDGIYQGYGSYHYEIYSLTSDGTKIYLDEVYMEVLEPSQCDVQEKLFSDRINQYAKNAELIYRGLDN